MSYELTDPIRILGLDLSLTSTGCAKAWGGVMVPAPVTFRITPAAPAGFPRLHSILTQLGRVVQDFDPDLVVVEGQALMTRGAYHLENSGLWWNCCYRIWKSERPMAIVPIQTLKRFATGSGKADKTAMCVAAARRFGLDRIQPDEADALWLAAAGAQQYGWPLCQLPADQVAVLGQKGKGGRPLIGWPPTPKPPQQAAS